MIDFNKYEYSNVVTTTTKRAIHKDTSVKKKKITKENKKFLKYIGLLK